ncbi:MAG: ABC transporter ATP-binding protein [Sphaerochaetaceae bacterium]|nr:ABC transporter ATP-binding protein [Sphaerochaetaceae bacterium]
MSFGELKGICVSYDNKNMILENLDLEIHKGELLSLLGPSGCGKTTTLRVIEGLMGTVGGTFILDGKDMTHVPVHDRGFGVVFQSYALFPHLSVRDNIAFGLKMRKEKNKELINEKVEKMAALTEITPYLDRFPKQLSGGQRQRVALARALVIEPKLLLLDEPLSNLDAQLRIQMRTTIKRIQQELGITTIFVTHDQEECFSVSDRVAIMDKGKIVQCDTPEAIYHKPANEMIARFVGFKNFYSADVYKDLGGTNGGSTLCCSRPSDFTINAANGIDGTIEVRTYLGSSYQYEVNTKHGFFTVVATEEKVYNIGDEIKLSISEDKTVIIGE